MKRRNTLSIGLMMGASLLVLSACGEPQIEASVYESVEQCKGDRLGDPDKCESNFNEAKAQHAAVAPKYAKKEDCAADFGVEKCERAPYRTSSGGSIFMPLMAGYMMGSLIRGGRSGFGSQPLYRSTSSPGTFRTADNKSAGSATGRTQVTKSATSRPSIKSTTMKRGGFGSSGRRFGSAAT
jgi:uncharacterized protein YgiB involved in biofilm formation